jgi:hypothetical protein
VLRRTFGLKRDEEIGGWRKLHNGELHNLYSLPNIIRMIKQREMRWEGDLACMGEKEHTGFIWLRIETSGTILINKIITPSTQQFI